MPDRGHNTSTKTLDISNLKKNCTIYLVRAKNPIQNYYFFYSVLRPFQAFSLISRRINR